MRNRLLLLSMFIILVFCNKGNCYDEMLTLNFKTSSPVFEVYEGEFLTICIQGVEEKDLDRISGSKIDLSIVDGWTSFNNPSKSLSINSRGNCFHFKANKSNKNGKIEYRANFSSENKEFTVPDDIIIVVKKRPTSGTILHQNNLFIKGIDSSIDREGTDKIILGNSVPIEPFTSFSISSFQNSSGESSFGSSYDFMYVGEHDLDDNGVFCILISDDGYQAFGEIPDINISFNGSDFTPFFSITNALPNPTSTSLIPDDNPNILSITQGDYIQNSSSEIEFIGNEISSIGINSTSFGSDSQFGPGIDFSPTGDFNAIFVCDGYLYFCDLEELFQNTSLWNLQNGGDGRDDFDEQTCIDFCSIIDNDCNGIEYEVDIVDCEIKFSISNCSILSASDIVWYYKNTGDCSEGDFTELSDPNFTLIKDSPTSAEISLPIPYNFGCYKIEILCDECLSPITKVFEVDQCCPFAYEIISSEATCSPSANIDLEILGVGTPPFTYQWNNGSTNEDLTNVPGGEYTVTVTDANGCADTISTQVTSCCCQFALTFESQGLEIMDIYVNDIWLSDLPGFTFPYDNNGETSTSANLLDLVDDLNAFESGTGVATLIDGIIAIETCNTYHYIVGTDIYGKNDECENNHVTTVTNYCDFSDNPVSGLDCELNFDLISNGDCSLDVIISSNDNYTVTLEYKAFGSNVWTTVISGLSYSTTINYAASGTYRLLGLGNGICPEVESCEIEHICCECTISEIELIGDYLEDEELCSGIDSLGFKVTTENCLGDTDVTLLLPDGSSMVMDEIQSNEFELLLSTNPTDEDNGTYNFLVEDSYGCYNNDLYEINVDDCSLCSNCELLLPITSYYPGKINIYDFSVNCGVLDSFQISWYLNSVDPDNILFQTGTSDNTLNHPLFGFPVQGGTIIPVLDWAVINGDLFSADYPGIGNCLDSILVDTPECGNSYLTSYNYNTGGYPDRIIEYKFENGEANYLHGYFRGYDIHDTIKISNNGNTLMYAAIGSDIDITDYTTSPQKIRLGSAYNYLLSIQDLDSEIDSIIKVEIFANKTEPNTNWQFKILCVDDYDCGTLGSLDASEISCQFDSLNCKYNFVLPHPDEVLPENLPYKLSHKMKDSRSINKSLCSSENETMTSDDYCDIDSFSIIPNIALNTYTYDFHGESDFYSTIKSEILSWASTYPTPCVYQDSIDYYRRLILNAQSGTECVEEEGSGDGSSSTTYSFNFSIHPCLDNIVFDDNEKKITFKKNQIFNYQENQCDECKTTIENSFVDPINDPVYSNNQNLTKVFYGLIINHSRFKFKDSTEIINSGGLNRYITYNGPAAELCNTDTCTWQSYNIVIDDLDNGCSNFSVYMDPTPCSFPISYDSLVYQVVEGDETLVADVGIANFIQKQDLHSIVTSDEVENYSPEIKVFPNPSKHRIQVSFTSEIEQESEVIIYNHTVNEISRFKISSQIGYNNTHLDISDYPSGLYYIRVKQSNTSLFERFIKIN